MSRAADLHPIEASELHARRERVFLVLAGIFLGAMTMLNILGITKFIHFGPLELAVGVLPYPLTFLCTDFVSELYGRRRANWLVAVGLIVNLMVLSFIWAADLADPIDFRTPEQRIVTLHFADAVDEGGDPVIDETTGRPFIQPFVLGNEHAEDESGTVEFNAMGNPIPIPLGDVTLEQVPGAALGVKHLVDPATGTPIIREEHLFDRIATTTRLAMLASMIAYVVAQFVDVWLFHFWKRLTKGRMLWLRNNGSTMISQLVDATCVIGITFFAQISSGDMAINVALGLIGANYLFKLTVAAVDTIPFYIGVSVLSRYLRIEPTIEHDVDAEQAVDTSA